jgi:hypothetical protein
MVETGFGAEAAITAQLWMHQVAVCLHRFITSGHRLILIDHLP